MGRWEMGGGGQGNELGKQKGGKGSGEGSEQRER